MDSGGYMVAEWTRADGYCDTGIRTGTYAEAEAAASRMHQTYGAKSRYLPMSLRRAIELGAVWGGGR
ncbi:hypothetical protein AB0B97_29825 [Micromonospora sp. NPDC049004]|uniref:hypothetical protein n=1 Tax=Micromonospora sp. NPDC049004 TaxID=3154348 RepID=UPI0033DD47CA